MDESQNGAIPLEALDGEVREADLPLTMDEDAFALFYQATARRLWAYLWHVSRDRQRTDDLVQETYFRFLRGPRRFQSDDHRQHYLFRIATNLVLDDRRRPRLEVAALPPDVDAAAPSIDSGLEAAVYRTEVRAAIDRMRPRDRSLLWLAYGDGASHHEIAARTGLTIGSVKQLLFRARRRLASLLEGA